MTNTLKIDRDLLATAHNFSTQADTRINFESTLDQKRLAVLERSVYTNGVRMLQQQERFGYLFTVILSLIMVVSLFFVMRMF
jgi:hypothetical protein